MRASKQRAAPLCSISNMLLPPTQAKRAETKVASASEHGSNDTGRGRLHCRRRQLHATPHPLATKHRRPLPQPPTPTLAGAAVGAAAAGDPILAGVGAAAAGDPMMRSPRAARWRTAAAATRNRLPLRGRRATYDAAILRCCNRPAASAGAAPLMQFYCLSPSVGVRPRNCVPGVVGGRRRGRHRGVRSAGIMYIPTY